MDQTKEMRLAMWSGPRNISTAMMRSFENRPDTMVVDEPFYACYLKQTGSDHPGREVILAEQSSDPATVQADLLAPLPQGVSVFYQKQMCHHITQDMMGPWMDHLTHAFLIRDPRMIINSYIQKRDEISLPEIGIPQQMDIFKRTADKLGKPPPVIESADVLKDPQGTLSKLCMAVGIPFHKAMLTWPAGKRDSDGVWAPWWYNSVEKSTGFGPYKAGNIVVSAELQSIADAAMPIYEEMSRYKL